METTWKTALKASISDVFLTMFFMVPEENPESAREVLDSSAKGWFEGTLEVKKPGTSVQMLVWSPPAITGQLAANIFSCDLDQVDPGEVKDAYKEMMNMVAGGVLTSVDTDADWKMGLPQVTALESGNLSEFVTKAQSIVVYEVDGKPMITGIIES